MAEVVTPKKPVRSSFSSRQKCVLCGSVLDNQRNRVKLKQELVSKLQEIVVSENLDPEGNLCNDNCYKSVNKYFELKAALKSDLTQKFKNVQGQSLRWKRELPSDVPVNGNSSAKASIASNAGSNVEIVVTTPEWELSSDTKDHKASFASSA